MKRPITLLAVLLLSAVPASARAQVGFGIKGGLSYGDVSNSGALPGDVSSRSGFTVGLGATLGSPVGIGIEALYAQRGVNSSIAGDSRRLNYLDVPAYLRVALPTPGISPFAYAGPQASFEMQCDADGATCPNSGRPKTTYAGVIGAGLTFGALRNLSIDARYIYGLTDLKLSTVSTSESYKTRSFMVLLGIGF
jgi:opacity protein-like surface antigen